MKTTYRTILFLLTGLVMLAGCTQKELNLPAEGESSVTDGQSEWVSLRMEGKEDSKVSVNDAGAVAWTAGDQIAVHTDAGAYRTFPVDPYYSRVLVNLSDGEARNGYAVYPETAVVNNSAETVQVRYPDSYDLSGYSEEALATLTEARMPMVAANTPGAALNFYHVGGIIRIKAIVPPKTKSLVVTVTGDRITGTATVTNPGTASATTSISSGTGRTITFTLPGANGLTAGCTVVLNMPVPCGTYTSLLVSALDKNGFTINSISDDMSCTIGHAQGRLFEKTLTFFTAGSDKHKIVFATSNLQYTQSTGVWSFMEHPYTTVETEGQNVGENYANQDVVSLFGWGTSGHEFDSEYSQYYQPNCAPPKPDPNTFPTYNYGPPSPESLTGTYALGDWGVKNAIVNGSVTDPAGTWRTPTREELTYIYKTRSDTYRFACARVHEVNGLLLFPDGFVPPAGITINDANNKDDGMYDTNVLTDANWDKLAAAGVIFLPAAGSRAFSVNSELNYAGYYWTSSRNKTYNAAYTFVFSDYGYDEGFEGVETSVGIMSSWYGQSVRLVRDI